MRDERLDQPESLRLGTTAAAAINAFTRWKMREDGFFKKIFHLVDFEDKPAHERDFDRMIETRIHNRRWRNTWKT